MGTKGSSSLWRRKQVHHTRHGDIELAKHLRIADLVSIGLHFSGLLSFCLAVFSAWIPVAFSFLETWTKGTIISSANSPRFVSKFHTYVFGKITHTVSLPSISS